MLNIDHTLLKLALGYSLPGILSYSLLLEPYMYVFPSLGTSFSPFCLVNVNSSDLNVVVYFIKES